MQTLDKINSPRRIWAGCGAWALVEAPDPNLQPIFGSVTLEEQFEQVVFAKTLTAGGPLWTYIEGSTGYINKAPSFRLNYTGNVPLRFALDEARNTQLFVRLPSGKWIADDDRGGRAIRLETGKGQAGRYDIYVGNVNPTTIPTKLSI